MTYQVNHALLYHDDDAKNWRYPCTSAERWHQALMAASSPGDSFQLSVLFIHQHYSGKRLMIDYGDASSTLEHGLQLTSGFVL